MNQAINDCLAGLNSIGKAFCSHAAGAFVQSALLVIVLFGIDLLLHKRVRAVFRYCVWLLVLVKLVLPPTLSLPSGIGYWVGNRVPAASPVSERVSKTIGYEPARQHRSAGSEPSGGIPQVQPPSNMTGTDASVTPTALSLTPIAWQAVVFLLWLVGVLAFALLLVQRLRFVKGLVAASAPAGGEQLGLLEQCRQQIGVRRQIGLKTLDTVPSPAVCGLLRPIVLMPTSLVEKLSPEGLRAALIHELAHIKRADLWVNAVQTFLQVVYFYNPFVWFANAIIRRTCEEAVDETVLVTLGGEAKSYSNTLIDIGEMAFWKADFGLRLVGVAESRKALQWRIKHMLTRPVPQSARIGALGTIAILVVAAVLLPMARAEKSSKDASVTPLATDAGATEKAPVAGESDTIIDPKTGLKFTVANTFAGDNNVIEHLNRLTLSPDGRFLLWWGKVVPLDGTKAFRYTENGDDREVAVSPNGRYVAHGEKAVWLQPVSPETLKPNGPAKKLLDLTRERLVETWGRPEAIRWTWDSKTVFFQTQDTAGKYRQYAFSAATGGPVSFPDAVARGLRSPDGKCVAFTDGNAGFWVRTVGDGTARNLCGEGPAPLCWSGDGRWLIGARPGGQGARFTRYPDGQEYLVPLPTELESSSACVGTSLDKSRLFFYQPGYELKFRVKVASAANGALKDVDVKAPYLDVCQWAPDGKGLYTTTYTVQGETGLVTSSLSGGESVQLSVKADIPGKVEPFSVSPDGKWVLFTVASQRGTRAFDLGVVPFSVANHETSGSATVIFRNERHTPGPFLSVWSPDGMRVALTCKDDPGGGEGIWIAFTDGKASLRLTQTATTESDLKWSPDGSMMAFISGGEGTRELKVIPTAGGETRAIRKWDGEEKAQWAWSSDSKSLTIAEGGALVRQPLSGGAPESITNLKELGIEWTSWLSWSPDGSHLALVCDKPENKDLRVWGQLLFVRVEEGRLLRTAAVDLKGGSWNYAWSPDSAHVAYTCEDAVAVRPAGRLYALAVDGVLERMNAGAIPPTQTQTASAMAQVAGPTLDVPMTNQRFSDDFSETETDPWRMWEVSTEGPPFAHRRQNGELVLQNARAVIGRPDWRDYEVNVRLCVKQMASGGGNSAGIQFRRSPSNGGFDFYNFAFVTSGSESRYLWFGLGYRDAANKYHNSRFEMLPFDWKIDQWYRFRVEVRGSRLRGYVDDQLMAETDDERLVRGDVALSGSKLEAHFDDFSLRLLQQ
jgi:beta-lactamase regulating signal transducer with metallopeptidase domain/Tol biopolymer transport system component